MYLLNICVSNVILIYYIVSGIVESVNIQMQLFLRMYEGQNVMWPSLYQWHRKEPQSDIYMAERDIWNKLHRWWHWYAVLYCIHGNQWNSCGPWVINKYPQYISFIRTRLIECSFDKTKHWYVHCDTVIKLSAITLSFPIYGWASFLPMREDMFSHWLRPCSAIDSK